jgi:type II secretory pathway component PulJ
MHLPPTLVGSLRRATVAYTLIEMMISMTLMILVLGGVVYCHVMGGRMMQITQAKLGANDSARKAFGKLQDEIRGSQTISVGDGDASNFVAATNGAAIAGHALQIYPSTNASWWIRYYYASNTSQLLRITSSNNAPQLIASYVTNAILFSKEDYLGNTLTMDAGNSTVNVRLQFTQLSYPMTMIGTNNFFDYYQMQTRITRRALY